MKNHLKNKIELEHIAFAKPEIGEEEIALVTKCMRSGWLTTGPLVRQFEQEFAEYVGATNAIAVNSATSGLLLAHEALGIGSGDEVITTPYTFSATSMVIHHLGATPVFVDIEKDSFNINPDLIEAAITPKTKAITIVHFAGLPCDMDRIIAIARKHNLKVIEDAAHALPAKYKGKLIGNLDSDATIYSFYATKTITTGEGGMVVTRSDNMAKQLKIKRLHGISSDVFDRYTSTKPKWYYQIVDAGHKCNMTDIAAAIGIPQLAKADKFQQKRQAIKEKYFAAFKDLPITLPKDVSGENDLHSWHLFVIRLNDDAPVSRDDFIKTMAEKYAVGCSVHFIPLNHHPFWQKRLGVDEASFTVATDEYRRAVSLPIYTKMSDDDVDRVITACREILS